MSHDRKLSLGFNYLVPILCEDGVPGDTFSCTTSIFIRLAPQLNPVMADLRVHTEFFFVPNRILWKISSDGSMPYETVINDLRIQTKWEDFITGFDSYNSATNGLGSNYPPPAVVSREPLITFSDAVGLGNRQPVNGSIYDYLYGVPEDYMNKQAGIEQPLLKRGCYVSALPLRAYNTIWNEWYRDPDLQAPVLTYFSDGDIALMPGDPGEDHPGIWTIDTKTDGALLKRNWEKDYFTTCRPWQQKGQVTVHLENSEYPDNAPARFTHPHMPGDMPVKSAAYNGRLATIRQKQRFRDLNGQPLTPGGDYDIHDEYGGTGLELHAAPNAGDPKTGELYMGDSLYADLSTAGINIATLRNAFQLQKYFERAARYGSRYGEAIKAHFGVFAGDSRLDRPEFLGGGQAPVVFSEVLATTAATVDRDQQTIGEMAGHAISAMKVPSFRKTLTEHGWIIGLMSICAKTSYQNGVARRFTREGYLDFLWPEFTHLAEQPVLRRELSAGMEDPMLDDSRRHDYDNRKVFGYAPRYDEYRRREPSVHGLFKKELASWHLGRMFLPPPPPIPTTDDDVREEPGIVYLNDLFIEANTSDRIFASKSTEFQRDHYVFCHVYHHMTAARPLPKYADPGLADHF
ncbi:hypothetical protein FACS189467_7080 [Bacteroidia bacterium]|nr:hypothetical protein FACS189467_7080 [Bacteroidia bacterium]